MRYKNNHGIKHETEQAESQENSSFTVDDCQLILNKKAKINRRRTSNANYNKLDQKHRFYFETNDKYSALCFSLSGTGTPIGDPVEANALGTFFSHNNKSKRTIHIGSVKTNIGHLESAAGVAGLIKVLLMMKHETVVPSLMYTEANENPKVNLKQYGFVVPTKCLPWALSSNKIRTACVNSFGFGGTNAHAILHQYIQQQADIDTNKSKQAPSLYFIALSASDHESLKENIIQFLQDLTDNHVDLASLSYTSTCKRDHLPERKAFLVGSNYQLSSCCRDFVNSKPSGRKTGMQKKLVFVCCGVGTVWNGMFSSLLENVAFSDAVHAIDIILSPLTGWSIESKIKGKEDLLKEPLITHIAIFAYQIGLAALWENVGIRPDSVIGQSVGEVAAAYIAGTIDLTSAVEIIYFRSKVLSEVTGGSMAIISNVSTEEVEDYCKSQKGAVNIAVYNSSKSCTVSGTKEAVRAMKSQFEGGNTGKGKFKELNVQCAYHSHHVEPVVGKLIAKLDKLTGCSSETEIISSVTGKKEVGWCFSTGKYWGNNIRKPVLFSEAVKTAKAHSGATIFLEIGPGPVLHAHASAILSGSQDYDVLASAQFGQAMQITRQTICKLYEYGYNILWTNIIAPTQVTTAIPKYRFRKKKTLYQNSTVMMRNQGVETESKSHLYIERTDNTSGGSQFIARIDQIKTPFVYEHVVSGTILVPGAFHADVGFEVGKIGLDLPFEHIVVSVQFLKPIRVAKHEKQILYVTSESCDNGCAFYVKQGQTTMSKGLVRQRSEQRTETTSNGGIHDIKQMLSTGKKLAQTELYLKLEEYGFQYGNSFRVQKHCTATEDSCLVEIEIPVTVLKDVQRTVLHPCILDGLFQSTVAIVDETLSKAMQEERLRVFPVAVEAISVQRQPVQHMLVYTERTNITVLDTVLKMHYNSTLFDSDGNVIATVTNLTTHCKRTPHYTPDELKYSLTWEPLNAFQSSDNKRLLILTNSSDVCFLKQLQSETSVTCCRDPTTMAYQDHIATAFNICETKWNSKQNVDCIVIIFERHEIEEVADAVMAEHIYQSTLDNCWFLVILIRYLVAENIRKPLIVVTQNTQSADSKDNDAFVNIAGAEVWGFVRSIELEFVMNHITIVDVCPGLEETKTALLNFISGATEHLDQTETEIKLWNQNLYTSAFSTISADVKTPKFRHVQQRQGYKYSIRSETPRYISGTHLLTLSSDVGHRRGNESKNSIFLRVKTVSIHPAYIYPLTATTLHSGTVKQEGHAVWGVEYTGYQIYSNSKHVFRCGTGRVEPEVDNLENEWEHVAVFPTEMASVVCVPVECIVNMKDLRFYENGLLVNSILAWAISENIPVRSRILVQSKCIDQAFFDIFKAMVVKRRKAELVAEEADKVDVVVSLSSQDHQYDVLRKAKYVICLKHAVQADVYKSLVIKDRVHIKEIDITEILSQNNISKVLRKTVPWLNKNFSQVKHDGENRDEVKTDIIEAFSLPCLVPLTKVFDKASTYVITGGLTGLGWELLLLMAEMGAGTIATLNRRPVSVERAADIEQTQRQYACRILCFQADVNLLESVANAIKSIQSYPEAGPIRGLLHGAGTLDPALLIKVTKQQLDNVMRAKVLGTLNLHIATKHLNLDYFILQSSITSIIGQPCQGNYGAANSFLDTFAQWRRSNGLPAQAINWGALEVGMAANTNFASNFERRGYRLLTVQEIRCCFQQAIMQNSTGVIYANIDWHLVAKDYSSTQMARIKMKMRRVLDDKSTATLQIDNSDISGSLDIELLRKSDPDKQREAVILIVQAVAKRVLENDIESYTMTSSFAEMGLDSMSSVTFANSVYDLTTCRMDPHFMLEPDRTLSDIVKYLTDNLFDLNAVEQTEERISEDKY